MSATILDISWAVMLLGSGFWRALTAPSLMSLARSWATMLLPSSVWVAPLVVWAASLGRSWPTTLVVSSAWTALAVTAARSARAWVVMLSGFWRALTAPSLMSLARS